MCGQRPDDHVLSLRLESGWLNTDDKYQLNRQRFYNLGEIVITTFETERSVTLVGNNLYVDNRSRKLSLVDALKSGLVELVESGKDDVIPPPPTTIQALEQLIVPHKPSPKHKQVEVDVYTETTSVEWKEIRQPGPPYSLCFSESKDDAWAYYTEEFASLNQVPSARKRSVGREESTTQFTVRDDAAPPKFFAKLEMPQKCHLTGNTPFTFIIDYSTNSIHSITIDESHSPLSVLQDDLKTVKQLIDCRNANTGEQVHWAGFFGCGTLILTLSSHLMMTSWRSCLAF